MEALTKDLEQFTQAVNQYQEMIDEWDRYLKAQEHLNKYDDYAIAHALMKGYMQTGIFFKAQ